jgi:hypothetical protein
MSDKQSLFSFEAFSAPLALSRSLTVLVERSTGLPQEFREVYVSLKLTKSGSSEKSITFQTKRTLFDIFIFLCVPLFAATDSSDKHTLLSILISGSKQLFCGVE